MHRSLKSCSFLPLFLRTWSYFGNSFRIPRIFQNFCIQRENMLLSDVYKKSRINAWRNVFRELNVGLESRIICRRGFRGTRWGGGYSIVRKTCLRCFGREGYILLPPVNPRLICYWKSPRLVNQSNILIRYSLSTDTTTTDQSDLELRISALQEQLKQRKLEAERLRKEEKKLRKEKLRTKEHSLIKQLEVSFALFTWKFL